MKFLIYLGRLVKNILWALIIIIIYFLLIGMIKNGGLVNYFEYLNSRDWQVVSAEINILEPHTLTDIFYSSQEISGAMVSQGEELDQNSLTGGLLDSGSIMQEGTGLNAYDPQLESDLNDSLVGNFSGSVEGSGSFGFVSTGN
ncbi:MAG: hypothetical protein WAZ12_04225 [Candidatus Absconditicoccaceae bacterium]